MLHSILKNKYFNLILLTIILFVLSFPNIQPEISTGLDPSYFFALNHFFANDVNIIKDIIFTYGPLCFIRQPLPIGYNLEIGILCISIIRFFFIYLFLCLSNLKKNTLSFSFIIALILSNYIGFDYFIYGIVAMSIIIYRENKKNIFLIISSFFIVFGLLIKINIGIISSLIYFSFLAYNFYYNKNYKKLIYSFLSPLLFFLIFWFLLYGDMYGIINYFKALFIFSIGNSSAFSINPENNWYLLSLFFIIFSLIPVLSKDKNVYFLYIIFLLAFFAAFKYGFARQENYHLKMFLDFLILFVALFLITIKNIKPYIIALLFVMVMLLYRNMDINKTYNIDDKIQLIGINNFVETVWKFPSFKQKYIHKSKENLKENILPESMKKTIGDASVDCFPWDLTYTIANNFKYQPRPMLQSGCLYAPPFIDKKNAEFIASKKSAKFIIWEIDKIIGEVVGGIDGRYLFNSDGYFLYELLNNYEIIDRNNRVLLLKKTTKQRLNTPKSINNNNNNICKFNEWIDIPEINEGVLRAKVEISKTVLGMLKSAIYKEKEYFIEYKLEHNAVIKHRFYIDNADCGLWINPYITNITNNLRGEKVIQIRFSFLDNKYVLKDKIKLNWEQFTFKKYLKYVCNDIFYNHSLLYSTINDFEANYPNWNGDVSTCDTTIFFSGRKSFKLNSERIYSSTFSAKYSEITSADSCIINITTDAYITEGAEAHLVFTTERNGKTKIWDSSPLHKNITKPDCWNKIYLTQFIKSNILPDDTVGVYIWNTGKKEVYVDNIKIEVYSLATPIKQ